MASLQESYLITSDDEGHSLYLNKDAFGNLDVKFTEPGGETFLTIPEEIVSHLAYAMNRLT